MPQPTSIETLFADGRVTAHRSRDDAEALLPEFKETLKIETLAREDVDSAAIEFLVEGVLGAAWYTTRCKGASRRVWGYILANGALLIAIPVGLALLEPGVQAFSAYFKFPVASGGTTIVGALTGALTGILGLQKLIAGWYSAQQNYAAWYKAGADLKKLYFSLVTQWSGKASSEPDGFVTALNAATASARQVIDDEEYGFYQKLALPSIDILDLMTASRSTVSSFVTSLVPGGAPTTGVMVGTKVLPGPSAPVSSAPLTPHVVSALDPSVVETCSGIKLSSAADIAAFFQASGGFIAWYNQALSRNAAFSGRGAISQKPPVQQRFDAFWDQIPAVFGVSPISAIEFCALMSIGIQENSGDLWANPEKVGNAGHPHLAYAFDRIPGLKASYNTLPGNRTVFQLFSDPDFLAAHGNLPGRDAVTPAGGIDEAWKGDQWPQGFSTDVNPSINGSLMEADFYKFRGRGIIQTTGREAYKQIIASILSDPAAAANATLSDVAQHWRTQTVGLQGSAQLEAIATRSSNDEWDLAFGEGFVLAAAIRLDSTGKGNYLALSHDPATLGGGTSTRGSLFYMARKINAGNYPNTVVPMMTSMIGAMAPMAPASAALIPHFAPEHLTPAGIPKGYSELQGSRRAAPAGMTPTGKINGSDTVALTVILAPRAPIDTRRYRGAVPPSKRVFGEHFGARTEAVNQLVAYAHACGLRVVASDTARHTVKLSGTYDQASTLFVPEKTSSYEDGGHRCIGRSGAIWVPDDLAEDIVAVLGFDQRPHLRPHIAVSTANQPGPAYDPAEVARRYGFPDGTNGSGQTIALIEFGGGYDPDAMQQYFRDMGVARTGSLEWVSVDGAVNAPDNDPTGYDREVALDIQVAGSVAPGAKIVVYFTARTAQGFVHALQQIIDDQARAPSIISISWGNPESLWSVSDRIAIDQVLQTAAAHHITVCTTSGDRGAVDASPDQLLTADFPASSPSVLGCGGTVLPAPGDQETVWNENNGNASGGGYSRFFDRPDWQGSELGDKRGVPDVSGNAVGYRIRVAGADIIASGTSAVGPLWAGLIARINQKLGTQVGFINPLLYASPQAFTDCVLGNNDGYFAGPGWDAVTGLGSPLGNAILDDLQRRLTA